MLITSETLKLLGACEEGIDWFIKNGLENFPMEKVSEIQGDHENFVYWIRENYPLSQKTESDVLILETLSGIETYDSQGNQLTYKDSGGSSWKSTYDSQGNELTFKNSEKVSWKRVYEYSKSGQLLKIIQRDKIILCIPEF